MFDAKSAASRVHVRHNCRTAVIRKTVVLRKNYLSASGRLPVWWRSESANEQAFNRSSARLGRRRESRRGRWRRIDLGELDHFELFNHAHALDLIGAGE